jgi:hypothetical protein
MKLKFLQCEYEFDKEDAKIVVPIIILLLSVSFAKFNNGILIIVIYYLLYLFSSIQIEIIKNILLKIEFRCQKCKSR